MAFNTQGKAWWCKQLPRWNFPDHLSSRAADLSRKDPAQRRWSTLLCPARKVLASNLSGSSSTHLMRIWAVWPKIISANLIRRVQHHSKRTCEIRTPTRMFADWNLLIQSRFALLWKRQLNVKLFFKLGTGFRFIILNSIMFFIKVGLLFGNFAI